MGDRRVIRYGNTYNTAVVKVRGNVEVEEGDLMFLDRVDGLRDKGTSTADWYAYPFEKLSCSTGTLAANRTLAKENFVGVAAGYSESGVTEDLAVYADGIFRYPLKHSHHTKVGYYVVPAGSGTTLYNQKVEVKSDDSDFIGIVCDSGEFRSTVDVRISTLIKPLQIGENLS